MKKDLLAWFTVLLVLSSTQSIVWSSQKTEPAKRVYTDRMAGYDKTVVLTDETIPNSCIMTYFRMV